MNKLYAVLYPILWFFMWIFHPWKAVGRVLVAEAGSYLEIFVEARSHKQLLKLLRSLRQSIEFALVLS